ncbi:hypothetical protein FGO68_gene8799 [Halteria grandinella]|uniref:F-box/LRR-repeat protein 15-like leucin rich repeat domain-containing protein n=1 Tax=Halteria grandinella TaxID=5974 RepID=A0A8J8NM65_HALGN|nr:hypothetical protein FGO68_gene8799 [Halteria grandinella]
MLSKTSRVSFLLNSTQFCQQSLHLKVHRTVSKTFINRALQYFANNDITDLNFEFTPLSDEHFEAAADVLPKGLAQLNLNGCREISERTIMIIGKQCQKLNRLELYWNCRITDFAMKKLASSCKDLEYVNLSGCKYLSDQTVVALCENCPQIRHLNLTRMPKVTEKVFKNIAESLSQLTYLNLYADADLSDNSFRALAQSPFGKLTFLDFCGCKHITDQSVIALTDRYKELTYLNLTWCISLTDKAIVEGVAKHLTKLNLLSLFGIVTITDQSMEAMLTSPIRETLETLDINGCREITQKSEEELKGLFPKLRVVVFHS